MPHQEPIYTGPTNTEKPLILFVDAYDSFSNNIISLLETTLHASVRTVKIDDHALASNEALYEELRHYAAVVCGPGPGNPGKVEDVGIISRMWSLGLTVPVLGICLGFQSLCLQFGGDVKRLKGPQHGIIRKVTHIGETVDGRNTIFAGVGEIRATHYQSLCADLGHNSMAIDVFQSRKWVPTAKCPDLLPLAWIEWDGNEDNDSGMKDERILVAVEHRTKPFWALQYHPESICTNSESNKVIQNWFKMAMNWNRKSRKLAISPEGQTVGVPAVRESLLRQFERVSALPEFVEPKKQNFLTARNMLEFGLDHVYQCHTVKLPDHMSVPDIAEVVQDPGRDQIILESSNAHEINTTVKGRYSIIGLDVDDGLKFEYCTETNWIKATYSDGSDFHSEVSDIDLNTYGGIWPFLAQFLEKRHTSTENSDSPFWGGFMGYTTYEMGLEGIEVTSKAREKAFHTRPDLSFAWVTRSLVIDHEKGLIHLQDLSKQSPEGIMPPWMVIAALKLGAMSLRNAQQYIRLTPSRRRGDEIPSSSRSSISHLNASASTDSLTFPSRSSTESSPERTSHQTSVLSIKTPSDSEYESEVRRCQSYISSGDSYELCLTDQTTIQRTRLDRLSPSSSPNSTASNADSWQLYRTLRTRQPAPFASYIRLGTATLISASPERFLSWSSSGNCELRPMKGTVRKSASVSTLEQAKSLLDVPKEKAENLMIVDLVRHDLHGVCGSGMVSVPRLMVVEEYRSVFQMISIVRGQIPQPPSLTLSSSRYTGIDVLAASLPPGSMTGAPKKRSCEILSEIEKKERSLYSGVVGYMDVGGRGDWSVTIRSMYRWDDEGGEGGEGIETWQIGAGGAVTTLSTPEGEREEMQTKLRGTLGLF